MASLDLSQNGPSINRSYKSLIESPPTKNPSPTYASWAIFSVSAPLQNAFSQGPAKNSVLKVHSTGDGELSELIEEFNDGKVMFAFVRVRDQNTGLGKYVLIGWCGEGVPERVKGYFNGYKGTVSKVLHGYHVEVTARSESDLDPESIIKKVGDSSGARYSAATAAPAPINRPPPPIATKPVYNPTRTTGSAFNPTRVATYGRGSSGGKVDADGWGEDAPQVSRSTLEKVGSAYKPTKVDIATLRAQPSSTTSGNYDKPEPVRGAYQPVGKVDIAAIKAASRTKDERPEPVRGAYQPTGKVDIAAIRAQAQRRPENEANEQPKSVSERMSAFATQPSSQAERLTSLPKPKVAKKFGPGAPSFGTKPLTPVGFGTGVPTAVPVGTANKDFASQGGKTPAQLWAEKKARERGGDFGEGVPSSGSQGTISATSTGNRSYEKSQEEEPSSGGVSALRSKFAGVKIASPQHTARSASPPPPPPPPQDTRPSLAGSGAIAMPGFPPRPQAVADTREHAPPPPPAQPPRSPSPPSPSIPSVPGSPVRIIMPVARAEEEPVKRVEQEPPTSIPVESLSKVIPREEDLHEEESARARGQFAVEKTTGGGRKARVEYDYEKADTNEIGLVEGEIVTDVDMVDKDWWAGTNSSGENGLFPSNYVVLLEEEVEEEEEAPPEPQRPIHEDTYHHEPQSHAQPEPEPASHGKAAVAEYEYEAAEENELSFHEGALITDIDFPDPDWWEGTYMNKRGLFPSNYVILQE